MAELSRLTSRIRTLMEAAKKSGGVKDAQPSTDIPGDCLKAANGFRDSIKGGDKVEEAASMVAKAAQTVLKEKDDPLKMKRAAMDVESGAVKMKQAVDSIYGGFAEARQAFYAVALAWDMYEKQSEAKKPSADVKELSDEELASQIAYTAKQLQVNTRDYLEKASKASKVMREAAKKTGLDKGELTDSEKAAIVEACFAARNASAPLYGRAQGLARRAVELVARARAKEKYEAKAKGIVIELDVESDPEFGGMELL